ncbi:MAG: cobalamin-dependent protein [Bacteroidales bacterium]|nr:cobalamin-dependent protein [Bacteroidales bacterium]MCF8404232.1 cobalamin-dependent protein [Bacteroidales bacterium]
MEQEMLKISNFLILKKDELAIKIVEKQYKLQFSFWEPYGTTGKNFSIRDAGYHLPFLAEAIVSKDASMFTEYVAWVKVLFRGLNFPDDVMIKTLECTQEVISEEMPSEFSTIVGQYIEAGIREMQKPLQELSSYIDDSTSIGKRARAYNDALLAGNKSMASSIIMSAVEDKIPVKEIYLEIFQKSQYEVGRLWLSNQISVAKEHFCSAATQMIMSQLYPYIFTTERKNKTFVGASIGGELHEIGIRMVADFFEMEGWDTYYLGANSPPSTLLKAVEENEAQILGLSIAMPYHRQLLASTIKDIRQSETGKDLKIIIGGVALNRNVKDWESFGANAYAPNALKAIEEANKLVIN